MYVEFYIFVNSPGACLAYMLMCDCFKILLCEILFNCSHMVYAVSSFITNFTFGCLLKSISEMKRTYNTN